MDINEIYKLVSYMADKYQGAYLSPDEFNMAVNAAQKQYLNFLTGETAEYNQGARVPSSGFSNDITTGSSLATFLKEGTLLINSQLSPKPNDFYKVSAMRTTDDDYAVKRVSADKVHAYINNAIDAPTTTEPIYIELGTNFKFWGLSAVADTPVKIIYFRKPLDAQWVPVVDTLNYNSVASSQLEWPENDHMDIVYRTLGIIGINLKDGDLMRISQTVKNNGQ